MRLNANALRKPVRKGPQLLTLPNREACKREFMAGAANAADKAICAGTLTDIIDCELNRVETSNGWRSELWSIFWIPSADGGAKNITLQGVLPDGAGPDDYLTIARYHGAMAQQLSEKIVVKVMMRG